MATIAELLNSNQLHEVMELSENLWASRPEARRISEL